MGGEIGSVLPAMSIEDGEERVIVEWMYDVVVLGFGVVIGTVASITGVLSGFINAFIISVGVLD